MRVEILIVMDEAGQVAVSGPIDQKLLCYGLLAVARDVVFNHHAQAERRLVQPAVPSMVMVPKGS